MPRRRRLLRQAVAPIALAFVAVLAACGDRAALEPTPKGCGLCGDPGTVITDGAGYVEYTLGDAPLIISAPHGGLLAPASLPDRSCSGCVTVNDDNTQDLARRVASKFKERTGRRPHLVINLLRRAKLDANREVEEATGNNAALTTSWASYHLFLEDARGKVTFTSKRGLLLDLHGHGHAIPRLELGYLLSAADLRLSDPSLGAGGALARSSIASLSRQNAANTPPAGLLRGTTSLGAMLANNGFPSVPSPADPAPGVGDEYFTGGYITQRHGSATVGTVDAVHIEAFRVGARDTPENLDRYATALVSSALEYLRVHYGWVPAASAGATGRARATRGNVLGIPASPVVRVMRPAA